MDKYAELRKQAQAGVDACCECEVCETDLLIIQALDELTAFRAALEQIATDGLDFTCADAVLYHGTTRAQSIALLALLRERVDAAIQRAVNRRSYRMGFAYAVLTIQALDELAVLRAATEERV